MNVLITGASSGLGAELAGVFGSRHRVFGTRPPDNLEIKDRHDLYEWEARDNDGCDRLLDEIG